jgi:hypothetical protein
VPNRRQFGAIRIKPGNLRFRRTAWSAVRLLRGKAEHLVLTRPFRWQVDEATNAHAVRQPAIDCSLNEIGGEESQRDCHTDLSRTAVFALCYAVRICCWISDEFIKPTAATANRYHQSRTCFGAYRARVFRADPLGQEDLAPPPSDLVHLALVAAPILHLRLISISSPAPSASAQ